MTTNPQLLTSTEAAQALGIRPATLRVWRCAGHGPRYVRVGRGRRSPVAYTPESIAQWLEEHSYTSTAAEREAARRTAPSGEAA